MDTRREQWRLDAAVCAALCVAVLLCFHSALRCDFVNFDDDRIVTANPYVLRGFTLEGVRVALLRPQELEMWLPLTWFSHMLDVELFSLYAPWHHFVNLLLHSLNAMLLYIAFRRMTGKVWPSAFAALLFAVHPLRVEPVVWIASRKDVLSTFFLLLTVIAYDRYARGPSPWRYLSVALLYFLGLAAKPMVVSLPFLLLLLDYWPLDRYKDTGDRAAWLRRFGVLLREKMPLIMLAAGCSVLALYASSAGGSMKPHPLSLRVVNALTSYAVYLGKTVWPVRLAPLYPLTPSEVSVTRGVLAGLMLLAVSFFVLRVGRTRRYAVTGWFWYVVTLVPVSGLIQVGAHRMADRYTYVSSIGLFVLLCWGIEDLVSRRERWRRAAAGVGGVVALVLMTCTYVQVQHWCNSEGLWRHCLAVGEESETAHNDLGMTLLDQGRPAEAADEFRRAVALNPDYVKAVNNLALALSAIGEYAEAEAVLLDTLARHPNNPGLHQNLAVAFAGHGQYDKAKAAASHALELDPGFTWARDFLAELNRSGTQDTPSKQ